MFRLANCQRSLRLRNEFEVTVKSPKGMLTMWTRLFLPKSRNARRRASGSRFKRRSLLRNVATTSVEVLETRDMMSAVTSWEARGPGGGGALFGPSINPNNPNEIYIASDLSQVFHSNDGGATWRDVDFRQLQGGPFARVSFTNDPNIVYALDGTSIGGSNAYRVTRSTDAGQHWTRTTDPTESGDLIKLVVDPAHPNRLMVTNYQQMWVSQDGGQTFDVKFATTAVTGFRISGAFFDGDSIYLGTNQGLLVSQDGGQSFAMSSIRVPTGEAILSFAGAKQEGVTRFIAVTGQIGNVEPLFAANDYGTFSHVYRMDLGDTGWTQFGGTFAVPSLNGDVTEAFPVFVQMVPDNIHVAYLAGGSYAAGPVVFKTTDGGQSWNSVFQTPGNQNIATGWAGVGGAKNWYFGENAMGFTVSPTNPDQVIVTDFGFAHMTTDGGQTWRSLSVNPADLNSVGTIIDPNHPTRSSGLDNTSTWHLGWTDPLHVFGAYTDISGSISADGGQSWSLGYSGLSLNSVYRLAVHPTTGVMYAATSSEHDLYETTHLTDSRIDGGTGRVLFSANGGAAWNVLHDFGHPVSWVELDPNNSNRLYASVVQGQGGTSSVGGIWVSDNIQLGTASTWRKLANPPRTQGHPLSIHVLNDGTLVATYSARISERGTLGFTASSGVFVSTNGGRSWLDRSQVGMKYFTKDLTVDPNDPTQKTWYVGVWNGYGNAPTDVGGLYRTTDRGVTWTRIFSGAGRVSSATVNPTNPNELYLTTEEDGLWLTENLRDAQPTFTQDPAYPFKHPQRVVFNPFNSDEVWVTSFGSGFQVGHAASASGSIVLDQASLTIDESAGMVRIVARRVGGTGNVGVSYSTSFGNATAGSDYVAANGNLSWADGDFSDRVIDLPITDDANLETTEWFLLKLSQPTGGATLGDRWLTKVAINDNEPPQFLQFASPTFSANENAGTAAITVTRTGGAGGTMTVDYSTSNGTATAGLDYLATTGSLTFLSGEVSKTVTISLRDDAIFEGNEVLHVTLSNPQGGATLGTQTNADLTLIDREIGQFRFEQAAYNVNETFGFATISVERINGDQGSVNIAVSTIAGTALAKSDYTPFNGTLTFADGETRKSFNIPLVNDTRVEKTESFSLKLTSRTSGAALAKTQTLVKVNIADDEIAAPGVIEFTDSNYVADEGWGSISGVVRRTGGHLAGISVTVVVSGGTATAGVDFQFTRVVITFAEGQTTQVFTIPVINDTDTEGAETINLSLTSPTRGATLGLQSTATLTITDNDPLPVMAASLRKALDI